MATSAHATRLETGRRLFTRIVVGIDGSQQSLEAARQAALLQDVDGQLTLFSAWDIAPTIIGGTDTEIPYCFGEELQRTTAEKALLGPNGAGKMATIRLILDLIRPTKGRIEVALDCDQRLDGRACRRPALADEDDMRLKIRRQQREAAGTVAAVAAELDADVIVCGTPGVSAFTGAFLGSFTQRLLHIAPCSVPAVGPRSELNAVLDHASTRANA